MHQAVVTEAAVYKDGRVRIVFEDGRTLSVPPGEHHEAFQVSGGPAGEEPWQLISLPGGGLAAWVAGEQ